MDISATAYHVKYIALAINHELSEYYTYITPQPSLTPTASSPSPRVRSRRVPGAPTDGINTHLSPVIIKKIRNIFLSLLSGAQSFLAFIFKRLLIDYRKFFHRSGLHKWLRHLIGHTARCIFGIVFFSDILLLQGIISLRSFLWKRLEGYCTIRNGGPV